MSPRFRRLASVLVLVVLAAVYFKQGLRGQGSGQPSTRNGDWPHYTADMKGTRYSPLDQINRSNFNQLEVAWRFKTDNLGPRPEYKLEGTPLAVKGILYTPGGARGGGGGPGGGKRGGVLGPHPGGGEGAPGA